MLADLMFEWYVKSVMMGWPEVKSLENYRCHEGAKDPGPFACQVVLPYVQL